MNLCPDNWTSLVLRLVYHSKLLLDTVPPNNGKRKLATSSMGPHESQRQGSIRPTPKTHQHNLPCTARLHHQVFQAASSRFHNKSSASSCVVPRVRFVFFTCNVDTITFTTLNMTGSYHITVCDVAEDSHTIQISSNTLSWQGGGSQLPASRFECVVQAQGPVGVLRGKHVEPLTGFVKAHAGQDGKCFLVVTLKDNGGAIETNVPILVELSTQEHSMRIADLGVHKATCVCACAFSGQLNHVHVLLEVNSSMWF